MTDTPIKEYTWLETEAKATHTPTSTQFEKTESLKLEAGKIVKFTIDFSQPFKKWTNEDNVTKAIIPVTHKEVKKNLWLNVKNPLYSQLCALGVKGQTEFRVSTTGTQKETKYTIVEED
jgi:hypothetical protein